MGGKNSLLSKGARDLQGAVKDVVDFSNQPIDDISSEIARTNRSGIHLDPNVRSDQEKKDEAKEDEAQKRSAAARQKSDVEAQAKVKAANAEAGEGSSIILGGKRRKGGKSSTVSSGLGLSKGTTGLQS